MGADAGQSIVQDIKGMRIGAGTRVERLSVCRRSCCCVVAACPWTCGVSVWRRCRGTYVWSLQTGMEPQASGSGHG